MDSFEEKEEQLTKTIFKAFEEKTPLDYDIFDSMVTKSSSDLNSP